MAAATLVVLARSGSSLADLQVYRVGGQAWLGDFRLYIDDFAKPLDGPALPFTYPPLTAALFSLLTVPPWPAVVLVWTLSSLALFTVACVVCARHVHPNRERATTVGMALACGGLLLEPVRSTLDLGQVNLLLMGLVALDCLVPKTRWPRGLLIGIAAAVKLTPLVFVLFFLPRKQFKPVVTALATFAALGLAGFALAPTDSKRYWFESLLDPGRVGGLAYVGNQSLRGFLHRLWFPQAVETATWALLGLGVVVLVWWVVRRAGDDRLTALIAVAVGGLLISPVSWAHHWVWVVPGLLLLSRVGRRSGVLVALFLVAPMWFLPNEPDPAHPWAWWQHVIGNAYVWAGAAVLVVHLRRRAGARPELVRHPTTAAVDADRTA
ncbi:glycosyltransferase 87 family protein [Actinosynnema sp. NPDC050436]|uniref:glycosyltransferase 87 family protein n=1 Tax=Actinosynnema sp. NPDC050436 TaxID=3155659 RepID=UPI0033C21721